MSTINGDLPLSQEALLFAIARVMQAPKHSFPKVIEAFNAIEKGDVNAFIRLFQGNELHQIKMLTWQEPEYNNENLLMHATRMHNEKAVEFLVTLIKKHHLVQVFNLTNTHGITALLMAIVTNANLKIIKMLAQPSVINHIYQFNKTILHLTKDAKFIHELIACGADPALQDEDGCNALHEAMISNMPDKIQYLMDLKDMKDNATGFIMNTPMMIAASQGQLSLVKKLHQMGANIQATNLYGANVLDIAIRYGQNLVALYLINNTDLYKKRYLFKIFNDIGLSKMRSFLPKENPPVTNWEIEKYIVDNKPKLISELFMNSDCYFIIVNHPFLLAINQNNVPVFKCLVERFKREGMTQSQLKQLFKSFYFMEHAIFGRSLEIMETIAEFSDFELNEPGELNILMFACRVSNIYKTGDSPNKAKIQNLNIVAWLFNKIKEHHKNAPHSWLDQKDVTYHSALDYAIHYGTIEVVEFLLKEGAKIDFASIFFIQERIKKLKRFNDAKIIEEDLLIDFKLSKEVSFEQDNLDNVNKIYSLLLETLMSQFLKMPFASLRNDKALQLFIKYILQSCDLSNYLWSENKIILGIPNFSQYQEFILTPDNLANVLKSINHLIQNRNDLDPIEIHSILLNQKSLELKLQNEAHEQNILKKIECETKYRNIILKGKDNHRYLIKKCDELLTAILEDIKEVESRIQQLFVNLHDENEHFTLLEKSTTYIEFAQKLNEKKNVVIEQIKQLQDEVNEHQNHFPLKKIKNQFKIFVQNIAKEDFKSTMDHIEQCQIDFSDHLNKTEQQFNQGQTLSQEVAALKIACDQQMLKQQELLTKKHLLPKHATSALNRGAIVKSKGKKHKRKGLDQSKNNKLKSAEPKGNADNKKEQEKTLLIRSNLITNPSQTKVITSSVILNLNQGMSKFKANVHALEELQREYQIEESNVYELKAKESEPSFQDLEKFFKPQKIPMNFLKRLRGQAPLTLEMFNVATFPQMNSQKKALIKMLDYVPKSKDEKYLRNLFLMGALIQLFDRVQEMGFKFFPHPYAAKIRYILLHIPLETHLQSITRLEISIRNIFAFLNDKKPKNVKMHDFRDFFEIIDPKEEGESSGHLLKLIELGMKESLENKENAEKDINQCLAAWQQCKKIFIETRDEYLFELTTGALGTLLSKLGTRSKSASFNQHSEYRKILKMDPRFCNELGLKFRHSNRVTSIDEAGETCYITTTSSYQDQLFKILDDWRLKSNGMVALVEVAHSDPKPYLPSVNQQSRSYANRFQNQSNLSAAHDKGDKKNIFKD